MKKILIFWYAFLLVLLLMTSCGKKPIATEKTENNTFVENDAKLLLRELFEKSLAINDSFKKFIPTIKTGATKVEDCDSLCNEKIIEILKGINTQKQSGNNGYKLVYDELTKQLILSVHQGETINKYKDSISQLNELIVSDKKSTKTIPVKYIPEPIKYLAMFGAFCIALILTFILYRIIKIFNIKPAI